MRRTYYKIVDFQLYQAMGTTIGSQKHANKMITSLSNIYISEISRKMMSFTVLKKLRK